MGALMNTHDDNKIAQRSWWTRRVNMQWRQPTGAKPKAQPSCRQQFRTLQKKPQGNDKESMRWTTDTMDGRATERASAERSAPIRTNPDLDPTKPSKEIDNGHTTLRALKVLVLGNRSLRMRRNQNRMIEGLVVTSPTGRKEHLGEYVLEESS